MLLAQIGAPDLGSLASPEFLLVASLAVAAGLDLFLTLLVLAGVSLLAPDPLLPSAVADLGQPSIVAVTGVLYLLEAAAEQRPLPGLVWHSAQIVARPLAAGLLAALLLEGHPWPPLVAGVLAAAGLAFVVHGAKVGGGLLLELVPADPPSRPLRTLGEDAVVGGLLVLTLEAPEWAALVALTAVFVIVLVGPTLRRAHRFGLRLLRGEAAHLLSPAGWWGGGEIPTWCLRDSGVPDPESLEGAGLRGAPAGAWGIPGAEGFRPGWVLFYRERSRFAYRRGTGSVAVPLPAGDPPRVSEHSLCIRAELGEDGTRTLLLFPRDGPPSDALRGELARGAAPA